MCLKQEAQFRLNLDNAIIQFAGYRWQEDYTLNQVIKVGNSSVTSTSRY